MTNQDYSQEATGLLTIAEIARQFDLPESTARFYCKRFMDFLPHVGEGKRRRYRRQVLDVFAVILAEIRKRKNATAVESVLAARFPRNIDTAAPPAPPSGAVVPAESVPVAVMHPDPAGQIMNLMETQGQAIGRIADALGRLAEREEEISRLRSRLEAKETELDAMREELLHLRKLQDDSEVIHQQDLEQLRKWMGHLASEQAKSRDG